MFTGIISDIGEIVYIEDEPRLRHLRIACAYDPAGIARGASIACGGPCLTVTEVGTSSRGAWFAVDAAEETLAVTNVGQWRIGTKVNLERSLRVGDELGGHMVTGHVDGRARILAVAPIATDIATAGARFTFEAPAALGRFIAAKGSVALDGTSLTVNSVQGATFETLIIPHTLSVTTWRARGVGDDVNIEVDLMARYAARLTGQA